MLKTRDVRAGSWKAHRDAKSLGYLLQNKMCLVVVCKRCQHRNILYPANLIPRFGADFAAVGVRRHLRCSICRYTSANVHEAAR
jgi:hypothetical protein